MTMNLHYAVATGAVEDVASALRSGSDPNELDRHGSPPLAVAVCHRSAVLAALLVSHGARVDLQDRAGNVPLCYASALGWLEGVRLLLAAGAPVDGQCDCGSPLSAAVVDGRSEVLSLLISVGADVNFPNAGGFTPLMLAASNENIAAIRALVEAGAVVDARDHSGLTAYLHAALQGDVTAGRELLLLGADAGALSHEGKSAADIAAECSHAWPLSGGLERRAGGDASRDD